MGLKNMLDAGLIITGMKRNQWKSRYELESIQEDKLRKVCSNARENVPHFSKMFESVDVRCLEDLKDAPIMEKEDVKRDPAPYLHRGCRTESLQRMRTGGSTGIPMTIYINSPEGIYGAALRYHVLSECGFGPSDHMAVLTHSKFVTTQLQRFIYRISAFPPSERPEKAFSMLKAMRPSMLFTYPSVLAILAGINRDSGNPLRFPKAVSCSEMLSDKTRRLVSGSFGCQVRNYYGSYESWAMAWECGHGNMHVNSDSVIIEVVGKDGHPVREGESGEVLITSLWRNSMPFIRYRIGDVASLGGKCRCGRGLHVISSLEGRKADVIILPSGKTFSWTSIHVLITELSGILRFQCIQESRGKLHFLVIPENGAPCNADEIIRLFDSKLPEHMYVDVECVRDIPRTASGKMPEFVSRIAIGK
jgi:phenylacetate-CoA ligase